MKDLFNIIYVTKYRLSFNTNDEGYATTDSENVAKRILPIGSYWQQLITNSEGPKQVILSLTAHRTSGSKEFITYHKV